MPSTLDGEKRTVDVTFATPTPVLRYSWSRDEYYNEVLDMNGADLSRTERGLPVLDNHSRYGSVGDTVIGRAENIRREGEAWAATIRFSSRDNIQGLVNDIRDGIITDISFGYSVNKVERMDKKDGEQARTYMVRSWTPNEISFVTIPADPKAGVRSQDGDFDIDQFVEKRTNPDMTEAEKKAMLDAERKRAADITKAVAAAGLSAEFATRLIDEGVSLEDSTNKIAAEKQRLASDPKHAAAEAVAAERKRSKEIRDAVRTAKLDDEFATRMIDEGKSIDEARAAIIEEWAKKGPTAGNGFGRSIDFGTDEGDKFREAASDAILLRADPKAKLSEDATENARRTSAAKELRGMTMLRLGEEFIVRGGGSVRGKSQREIAQIALGMQRDNGIGLAIGDLGNVLGNTINRVLRNQYSFQEPTFRPWARQTTLKDFRPKTVVQLSDMIGNLDKVAEGGEYTYGTFQDGKEVYSLAKYGKKIAYTWEAMINDDLDAFSRIPAAIAQKAIQLESNIVYNNILLANPVMGTDSVNLFDAGHGNLAASGTDLTVDALAAARQAMRTQKSISGDYINIYPRYLLVGPAMETKAQQILQAVIMATKVADTNVFRGSMELIVEPRITDKSFYVISDYNQVDTVEYAYLEGEGGLFTETRMGWDVDGVEIKARLVFGAKAIDWRGLYKNPGL